MSYDPGLFQDLNCPLYRGVKYGRSPVEVSNQETRAVAAGTGALYFALDLETSRKETEHEENIEIYKFTPLKSFKTLNLESYCEVKGIEPEKCYAGAQSLGKSIHQLYGDKIQAACYPSQKDSRGIVVVIFPSNVSDRLETLFDISRVT